jgi:hypothetical protein
MYSCSRASAAALSTVLRTTTLPMETCDFQAPAHPKPLSRSRWNFERLIMSVRLRDVPKMLAIDWLEAAPQIGEIYNVKHFSYYTLHYLFFLVIAYSKNGWTDLHAQWFKRPDLRWVILSQCMQRFENMSYRPMMKIWSIFSSMIIRIKNKLQTIKLSGMQEDL